MDAERGGGEAPAAPRDGEGRFRRRAFLVGGGLGVLGLGGAALVAGPGGVRSAYTRVVCGSTPEPPPGGTAGRRQGTLEGRRVIVAMPRAARDTVPVVVMLPEPPGDARAPYDLYAVDRYLAASPGGFAIASVDGWPSADIVGALLPHLEAGGLDVRRIGLLGWAAGGAEALRLAAQLGSGVVRAVAATSPDVTAARAPLRELVDIPVWLGCGERDDRAPQTETMLKGLKALGATTEGGISSGCQDTAYRRRVLPEQLAFFARHL
ncbi:alpha/beta hydrolase family protein [Streptosporangium carneum]|uniref:Alpha/beta hydrolase n=1 Tax=Streptosporangium carneum TaxID=47481 RepID=A0A9W6MH64_9ACTN|nr:hypothetical protein [Streptosporangium carneum]GLK13693.1 hypothetical protein GCM10017600_71040 [Streptosporangium carneum]